jgi:hypothetical protein
VRERSNSSKNAWDTFISVTWDLKRTGHIHRILPPEEQLRCLESQEREPYDECEQDDRRQPPFFSDSEKIPDSLKS